jgi:hypothetical protein
MTHDELIYRTRHIKPEDQCPTCKGNGWHWYGSGDTYHGGMGTASCETDLCDKCWGSGDRHKTWTNVKALEDKWRDDLKKEAFTYIATRLGTQFDSTWPALRELASELKRLSRSRKTRPRWFIESCEALAKIIETGISERTREEVTG